MIFLNSLRGHMRGSEGMVSNFQICLARFGRSLEIGHARIIQMSRQWACMVQPPCLRICVFVSLRIFASHCCHQPYQSISCARCASSLLKMMLPLILSRNIDTSHTHSGLTARHHRIRKRTSPSAAVLYSRAVHNRLA